MINIPDMICDMQNIGMSCSHISDCVGVSEDEVRSIFFRNERRRKQLANTERKKLVESVDGREVVCSMAARNFSDIRRGKRISRMNLIKKQQGENK